jgi:hypothetical protein
MARASDGEGYEFVQIKEKIIKENTTSEREGATIASQARETRREGETGLFAWSSTRPDAGVFIADAICTTYILRNDG